MEAVAPAGEGGSGKGGGGRRRGGKNKAEGDSTPTDEDFDFAGATSTTEPTRDLKGIRDELNRGIARRRDLQDELDAEKVKLSGATSRANANTKALQQVMQVLAREGEHSDSNRVLVIKKGQMSMRSFFQNFTNVQNHVVSNSVV